MSFHLKLCLAARPANKKAEIPREIPASLSSEQQTTAMVSLFLVLYTIRTSIHGGGTGRPEHQLTFCDQSIGNFLDVTRLGIWVALVKIFDVQLGFRGFLGLLYDGFLEFFGA